MAIRFASRKEVMERLASSDIVLIVLDARNPLGTMSTYLERVTRGRRRLFVLNKSDLVPPDVSTAWLRWFACKGQEAVAISATHRLSTLRLRIRLRRLAKEMQGKDSVVVMVAGVPKTGKSSIINVLRGRRSATVSAYPGTFGYTKGFTMFNIEGRIYAWDTPGVFPDVRDPLERLIRLRPPEKLADPTRVAVRVIRRVTKAVPGSLREAYGVDEGSDPYDILAEIARRRGWLEKKTKEPLVEQASIQVVRDYLQGAIRFYLRPRLLECSAARRGSARSGTSGTQGT